MMVAASGLWASEVGCWVAEERANVRLQDRGPPDRRDRLRTARRSPEPATSAFAAASTRLSRRRSACSIAPARPGIVVRRGFCATMRPQESLVDRGSPCDPRSTMSAR